jgi:2-aminoadipate transaminase
MLNSLEEFMPNGVRWTHPQGGLFLWATLPQSITSTSIFEEAVAEKVAFVPGDSFFPHGGVKNTMRLNFSNSNPMQIATGIERLARVIRRHIHE